MRNRCEVKDCSEYVVGRGLCRKHYMRQVRKGSTDDRRKNASGVCSVQGCDKRHVALGFCRSHWWAQHEKPKREREPRDCAFCGMPVPESRGYRGPVSYCSRSCKEQGYRADGRARKVALRSYHRRRYNLTLEQVNEMAEAGCAICGTTDWPGRHKRPHVDHDHQTGRVRGILCSECNTGLGKFKDNPAFLEAAVRYLAS